MCMDIKLFIEKVELLISLAYLLASWGEPPHLTRVYFLCMSVALSIDVYIYHGHRPLWVWIVLNTPFMVFCYEKFLRKYCLFLARRVIRLFTLPAD